MYTDLNLAPGCTGKYICNEGYAIHTLYGHKEFNCTEYGIWNGNVTTAPVVCVCKYTQIILGINSMLVSWTCQYEMADYSLL